MVKNDKYIEMNGKEYHIIGTEERMGVNVAVADFKYKGTWHEVKNFQILKKLFQKFC